VERYNQTSEIKRITKLIKIGSMNFRAIDEADEIEGVDVYRGDMRDGFEVLVG
jgi:hypothetical protein